MPVTSSPPPETQPSAPADEDALEYRSVHTFAVLGVLLGALSAVVLFTASSTLESTLLLAPVPIAGLIVSVLALRAIADAPDLYTGKPMAQAGAALSLFFLVTGVGFAGYVYATEVPEGYARTSFLEMKPSEQDLVDRKLIPEGVLALIENQQPVFIKGYIRPDSIQYNQNLSNFLLVRDDQQCCFGDLNKVKFFDHVEVDLGPGLTTDYNRGLFRVGGVLTVGPGSAEAQTPLTYKLAANYVKP